MAEESPKKPADAIDGEEEALSGSTPPDGALVALIKGFLPIIKTWLFHKYTRLGFGVLLILIVGIPFLGKKIYKPVVEKYDHALRIVPASFRTLVKGKPDAEADWVGMSLAYEMTHQLVTSGHFEESRPGLYERKVWLDRAEIDPLTLPLHAPDTKQEQLSAPGDQRLRRLVKELSSGFASLEIAFFLETEVQGSLKDPKSPVRVSVRVVRRLTDGERAERKKKAAEYAHKKKKEHDLIDDTDGYVEDDCAPFHLDSGLNIILVGSLENLPDLANRLAAEFQKKFTEIALPFEGEVVAEKEFRTEFFHKLTELKETLEARQEARKSLVTKSEKKTPEQKCLQRIEDFLKNTEEQSLSEQWHPQCLAWQGRFEKATEAFREKNARYQEQLDQLEDMENAIEQLPFDLSPQKIKTVATEFRLELEGLCGNSALDYKDAAALYYGSLLTFELTWDGPGGEVLAYWKNRLLTGDIRPADHFKEDRRVIQAAYDPGLEPKALARHEKAITEEREKWRIRMGDVAAKDPEKVLRFVLDQIVNLEKEQTALKAEALDKILSRRNPERRRERMEEIDKLLILYREEVKIKNADVKLKQRLKEIQESEDHWRERHDAPFHAAKIQEKLEALYANLKEKQKKYAEEKDVAAINIRTKQDRLREIHALEKAILEKREEIYQHERRFEPEKALHSLQVLHNEVAERMKAAAKEKDLDNLADQYNLQTHYRTLEFEYWTIQDPGQVEACLKRQIAAAENDAAFFQKALRAAWKIDETDEETEEAPTEKKAILQAQKEAAEKFAEYLAALQDGSALSSPLEKREPLAIRRKLFSHFFGVALEKETPASEKEHASAEKPETHQKTTGTWIQPGGWLLKDLERWTATLEKWNEPESTLQREWRHRREFWDYDAFGDFKRQEKILANLLQSEANIAKQGIADARLETITLPQLDQKILTKTISSRPVVLRIPRDTEVRALFTFLMRFQKTDPALLKILPAIRVEENPDKAVRTKELPLRFEYLAPREADSPEETLPVFYPGSDNKETALTLFIRCPRADVGFTDRYQYEAPFLKGKKKEFMGTAEIRLLVDRIRLEMGDNAARPPILIEIDPHVFYGPVHLLITQLRKIGFERFSATWRLEKKLVVPYPDKPENNPALKSTEPAGKTEKSASPKTEK